MPSSLIHPANRIKFNQKIRQQSVCFYSFDWHCWTEFNMAGEKRPGSFGLNKADPTDNKKTKVNEDQKDQKTSSTAPSSSAPFTSSSSSTPASSHHKERRSSVEHEGRSTSRGHSQPSPSRGHSQSSPAREHSQPSPSKGSSHQQSLSRSRSQSSSAREHSQPSPSKGSSHQQSPSSSRSQSSSAREHSQLSPSKGLPQATPSRGHSQPPRSRGHSQPLATVSGSPRVSSTSHSQTRTGRSQSTKFKSVERSSPRATTPGRHPTAASHPTRIAGKSPGRAGRSRLADKEPTEGEETGGRPSKCQLSGCKKRLGLAAYACRCGAWFCPLHVGEHGCQYDYHRAAKKAIKKSHPKVAGKKIDKF